MSEQMSVSTMRGKEPPVGVTFFASLVMILTGAFHVVVGLAGITEEGAYAAAPDYWLEFTTTAWGWIHVILALLMVFAGMSLMTGTRWARMVGIVSAMISGLVGFAFAPLFGVWAIMVVAADVIVIWALSVHRDAIAEG